MTCSTLFPTESTLRPLRDRQESAIESLRQAIREGHKRIVLQSPTGFGKTHVAAHIISYAVEKGKRPLFTVPTITLVNQTLQYFEREGIKSIGVIQADHERTDWCAQVQIASVQTLIRRAMPMVDFVIVDEVHMNWAKFNERLDSPEWRDKVVIGLSATPWTKGMGLRWTNLIIASTIQELIDEGFLSPFIVYAPADEYEADLSSVKVVKGEFEEAGLAVAMDKPQLVADVVRTWQERGNNQPTFLFAVNLAHAKSLRDEFEAAGVSCGYIDAFSTDDQRRETFERFRDGRDKIIASVGCLTTGVDEDVRVIIDAAPTRSEIRMVQKIGRGLRMADGKDRLTILDHAGNTLRLGLVTDIYHDHLDTHKKSDKGDPYKDDKKAAKPRKCHKCHAVIPNGQKSCPVCGERVVVVSGVQSVDGELIEFGSGAKPKKIVATMAEKQQWYSGMLALVREQGKNEGMAAHRYREKFGVWPNQLQKVPGAISLEVRNFDKHMKIRYIKGKQKGASK